MRDKYHEDHIELASKRVTPLIQMRLRPDVLKRFQIMADLNDISIGPMIRAWAYERLIWEESQDQDKFAKYPLEIE
jgi:hypothetical protein